MGETCTQNNAAAGKIESDPIVTVIVPGYNTFRTIEKCLSALVAQEYPADRLEILYVDDASTDASISIASRWATRVIRLQGQPRGPAGARNAGVDQAAGDVIIFLDADVVAPPQTVRKLVGRLRQDNTLDAVFGSYDSEPSERNIVSQYRNLLHHFVHQTSRGEASTFWAGCGAIWKHSFRTAGGFDAGQYSGAMIEDIELGHRMRALGMHIALDRTIMVKHLKRWTFIQMVRADIFQRGIPWVRLLLRDSRGSSEIGDLNLRLTAFLSVFLAWAGILLILPVLWFPWLSVILVAILCAGFLINLPLCRFFYRIRGLSFAVMSSPLQYTYHVCNGVSVGLALLLQLKDRLAGKAAKP